MANIEIIYKNRKLSEGFPDLEKEAYNTYINFTKKRANHVPALKRQIKFFNRLINLNNCKNILLIGCGPKPISLKYFLENEFNAYGVEPVPYFVESAAKIYKFARKGR